MSEEQPLAHEDEALARFREARSLGDAGDHEKAAATYEALVTAYGSVDGSALLRDLVAGALVNAAAAFEMTMNRPRAQAAYGTLLSQFDPGESEYIAECVEIARERYQKHVFPRP